MPNRTAAAAAAPTELLRCYRGQAVFARVLALPLRGDGAAAAPLTGLHHLHRCFRVPCGQMRLPPHALHVYLILRCKQMAPTNVASPYLDLPLGSSKLWHQVLINGDNHFALYGPFT